MDLMRVWTRCKWVYMYEVAWSTKTVTSQKRSEVKKPDIYGMIPGVLDVKASKDVLSPEAVSDSLMITCLSFPFTLQGLLCAHPNMHDAQTGGWQNASLESKIPIVSIPCISLIGTQWFFLSWISKSFVCSWVRVLGFMALMISSASFLSFLSRKISCLSFD